MPSLHDMFQLFLMDQFSREEPESPYGNSTHQKEWNIPVICKLDKTFQLQDKVYITVLPTIPVKDESLVLCRAYYVFQQPRTSFSSTIVNTREFMVEEIPEFIIRISIIIDLKELLLFPTNINFVLKTAIEPWMNEERERMYYRLYG